MTIKIIKDGKKELDTICPYCGCEFTYEAEDMVDYNVKCPCCSKKVRVSWATKSDNLSGCEGCPNNPKYLKHHILGDSPCQWCQKNPWKVTCK